MDTIFSDENIKELERILFKLIDINLKRDDPKQKYYITYALNDKDKRYSLDNHLKGIGFVKKETGEWVIDIEKSPSNRTALISRLRSIKKFILNKEGLIIFVYYLKSGKKKSIII